MEDICSELRRTWTSWTISSKCKFNELQLIDMSFDIKYQMTQIDRSRET